MTKFPAELPQLTVRVAVPMMPREQENLPVALAGGVTRSVPAKIAIMNREKANLAKERLIRAVSVFDMIVSPEW
jgi:hypothetical protein